MMTIPAGAERENAHKLMNFLMRPEIIADVTNYVWYANPNKPANEFVDLEILNDTSIPTDEVIGFIMEGRPQDAQRLMTRTRTNDPVADGGRNNNTSAQRRCSSASKAFPRASTAPWRWTT